MKLSTLQLQEAFAQLYPLKERPSLTITYSGKFSAYNANVSIKKFGRSIQELSFRVSKNFLETDEIIQIGIVQHLLNKVYKTTVPSLAQDLYLSFVQHVTKYAPRKVSEDELVELFEELNKHYFLGLMVQPNLRYGREATTVLGHYNFQTDTVTISPVLREERDLLAFVLYHELLHKKHGFEHQGGRTAYHTKEFRADEKKFQVPDVEKKLEVFVRKKKRSILFDSQRPFTRGISKARKKLFNWF